MVLFHPELQAAPAAEVLSWAHSAFGDKLAIGTSFQKEGMVLIDMASRLSPRIPVFTVDTGRLPEETHRMIEIVRERYGVPVEVLAPETGEVETMVGAHGADLFYGDSALRMLCCHIRKVRPLERKLATLAAWVAGLRRSQSATRDGVAKIEDDRGTLKISPLADWSAEQVERYIAENDVPLHPLYAKGYATIGCDPCTRAVAPGEDSRAGRWWWEPDTAKECGMHFTPEGKAVRRLDILVSEVLSAKHA